MSESYKAKGVSLVLKEGKFLVQDDANGSVIGELSSDDVVEIEGNLATLQAGTVRATQSRWRSKVLWGAVIAQALALAQMTGLLARIGVDAGTAGDVAAAVLQLLAIVGVINDPTNGEGW